MHLSLYDQGYGHDKRTVGETEELLLTLSSGHGILLSLLVCCHSQWLILQYRLHSAIGAVPEKVNKDERFCVFYNIVLAYGLTLSMSLVSVSRGSVMVSCSLWPSVPA